VSPGAREPSRSILQVRRASHKNEADAGLTVGQGDAAARHVIGRRRGGPVSSYPTQSGFCRELAMLLNNCGYQKSQISTRQI
jgi:hypothetical protein